MNNTGNLTDNVTRCWVIRPPFADATTMSGIIALLTMIVVMMAIILCCDVKGYPKFCCYPYGFRYRLPRSLSSEWRESDFESASPSSIDAFEPNEPPSYRSEILDLTSTESQSDCHDPESIEKSANETPSMQQENEPIRISSPPRLITYV